MKPEDSSILKEVTSGKSSPVGSKNTSTGKAQSSLTNALSQAVNGGVGELASSLGGSGLGELASSLGGSGLGELASSIGGGSLGGLASSLGGSGLGELASKFGGSGLGELASKFGGSSALGGLASSLGGGGLGDLASKFGGSSGLAGLASNLGGPGAKTKGKGGLGTNSSVSAIAQKLGFDIGHFVYSLFRMLLTILFALTLIDTAYMYHIRTIAMTEKDTTILNNTNFTFYANIFFLLNLFILLLYAIRKGKDKYDGYTFVYFSSFMFFASIVRLGCQMNAQTIVSSILSDSNKLSNHDPGIVVNLNNKIAFSGKTQLITFLITLLLWVIGLVDNLM